MLSKFTSVFSHVHFNQTQEQGTLRWIRALLVPYGNNYFSTRPLIICRGIFLVLILAMLSWDAGLYNHAFRIDPGKPFDGEHNPWIVYGPSLAMLACLMSMCSDLVLWFTCAKYVDDGGEQAPMPLMGQVAWALKIVSFPAITATLILYVQFLRPWTTYRASLEVSIIVIFTCMALDFLISNTPYLVWHVFISHVIIQVYIFLHFFYEAVMSTTIYPFTGLDVFLIIVFYTLVHLLIVYASVAKINLFRMCGVDVVIWQK